MADVPNDLIEIHDPELDPATLLAQIRERLEKRRRELGEDKRQFPSFDVTVCPDEPRDLPYDVNLYHHLRLANELYATFDTEPMLPPTDFTRVPVLGKLWERFRPALHKLILIYVNRLGAQQTTVNRHLVSVLNQLTLQCQEQQRAIAALQAEIATLRR